MLKKYILVTLIALCCNRADAQPYKYLALKGGGIRGIAYTGAIKVLEEKNIITNIEKVGGTSAGAIAGMLICLGYTAKEIETIMDDMRVDIFNDGEGSFMGGQWRMRKSFGWYKGEAFEDWLGECLQERTGKENITLGQLHNLAQKDKKYKDLYVTATNLSKQQLEIFSHETYPDMEVKVAVRASMSIPLYYGAMFIDSQGQEHDKPSEQCNVFVDGGLVAIYPIDIFNDKRDSATHTINKHTLGLKLERPEQITHQQAGNGIAPYNIRSFNNYMAALYNLTLEQLNRGVSYEEEKKHTIYISTSNLHPRVRHISRKQKRILFQNGESAARAFFEKPTAESH